MKLSSCGAFVLDGSEKEGNEKSREVDILDVEAGTGSAF